VGKINKIDSAVVATHALSMLFSRDPLKTAHRQLRWLSQSASQQRLLYFARYTKQIARRAAGSPILCYELRWPLFGQEEADMHTEAVAKKF
jgi:hypothetical protein